MKLKNILEILDRNQFQFVLIGGVALNIYGSDRVTFDSDLAIKTVDIDRIIEILLSSGLEMVVGVDKNQHPELSRDPSASQEFAGRSTWGFLKFLSDGIELDVIYDIAVPFMQLYKESIIVEIGGSKVRVASLEHIRLMKEKAIGCRDDEKRESDLMDLRFIEKKIRESKQQ